MRNLLVAVVFLAWAPAAFAQWIHEANADAFSDDVLNVAVGGGPNGNGVGFRCNTADDLILLFMTTEEVDDETVATLNSIAPTVMVRVDDNPVVTLDAEMVSSPKGTLVAMVERGAIADLAHSVAAATDRVAVAIEMLGERYHSTNFMVRGSTRAIAGLMEGCGIE